MNPSPPTPAAQRAALAISNSVANPALSIETRNCTAQTIASIIDQETGIPDLIETVAWLVANAERWRRGDIQSGPRGRDADWFSRIERAKTALARLTGKEAAC